MSERVANPPQSSSTHNCFVDLLNMEIRYTVCTQPLRLCLFKGEGRVRVEHRVIVWPEPLTLILSPSRGEADQSASVY